MNKITLILIIAISAALGLAVCYFILRVPLVVDGIDSVTSQIKLDEPTSIVTAVAGVGGSAAAVGIPLILKAKSTATAATNQLKETQSQLSSVTSKADELTDAKTQIETQLAQAQTQAETATNQAKAYADKVGALENQVKSLATQNQQLVSTLENRPVQIIEKTVVK
jgi:septal ring factor EnvC (AmiA/AmiB activator)